MSIKYKKILMVAYFLFSNLLFATDDVVFSVELKAVKQKSNISNSNINISITNNSTKDLKLLKWNTPLESTLSADIFDVKQDGKKTTYIGRLVKRGKPTDTDFVLLKAGEVITTSLEIAKYYKMDKKAKYQIAYKGSFLYDEEILSKQSKTTKIRTLKREKISKKSMELDFEPLKKDSDDEDNSYKLDAEIKGSCTTSEIAILNDAHNEAISLINTAYTDMDNAPVPTTYERYEQWFGEADTNRQNIVKNNLYAILNALDVQQMTFNCDCNEDYFAYVYPDSPYEIFLCNTFWNAPLVGTDSKAGTLIHETSHFTVVAGTDDYAYGQSNSIQLAIDNPDEAVHNADSHEYFAENTPSLSMTSNYTLQEPEYIIPYSSMIDGYSIDEDINPGDDTDVYEFTAPTSGSLLIYTTGSLDTIGRLYDRDLKIASNDDEDDGLINFKINKEIYAGKHYIAVDSYSNNTGNYTLHVIFTPSPNANTNVPIIMYLLN